MDNGPFCCTRTTARFTCSLAEAPTCNAAVVAVSFLLNSRSSFEIDHTVGCAVPLL